MENTKVNTPPAWKKYEAEARLVCLGWLNSDQTDEWNYHIQLWASKVYNDGDGLVFIDFNEQTQKSFMRKEYKEWMAAILDEVVNDEVNAKQVELFGAIKTHKNTKHGISKQSDV